MLPARRPIPELRFSYSRGQQKQCRIVPIALLYKANNRIWVLDPPYSWSKRMLGRQGNTQYYRPKCRNPIQMRLESLVQQHIPSLHSMPTGIPGLLIAAG